MKRWTRDDWKDVWKRATATLIAAFIVGTLTFLWNHLNSITGWVLPVIGYAPRIPIVPVLVGYAVLQVIGFRLIRKDPEGFISTFIKDRNVFRIQDGNLLCETPLTWEQVVPDHKQRNWAATKEINLQGYQFHSISFTVDNNLPTEEVFFGVILTESMDYKLPFPNDPKNKNIALRIGRGGEGVNCMMHEGRKPRARKKYRLFPEASAIKQTIVEVIVNDKEHLALTIQGRYVFAKRIDPKALNHLTLYVEAFQNKDFNVTISDIKVRVYKPKLLLTT